MVRRIKGVSVAALIDGRGVEVIFTSPYRWRVYEGDREVTREFGFNGRALDHDDPRRSEWHEKVDAGECRAILHTA